jgi:hypothetical protein
LLSDARACIQAGLVTLQNGAGDAAERIHALLKNSQDDAAEGLAAADQRPYPWLSLNSGCLHQHLAWPLRLRRCRFRHSVLRWRCCLLLLLLLPPALLLLLRLREAVFLVLPSWQRWRRGRGRLLSSWNRGIKALLAGLLPHFLEGL